MVRGIMCIQSERELKFGKGNLVKEIQGSLIRNKQLESLKAKNKNTPKVPR